MATIQISVEVHTFFKNSRFFSNIDPFQYQVCPKSTHENRARGNRKTVKWLEMITKSNFRTLKLKSHEEYLIYGTYFIK